MREALYPYLRTKKMSAQKLFLKSKFSFASFSDPLTDVNLFIYYSVLCITYVHAYVGFPVGSNSKESACNAGDLGSIPGSGRYPPGRREWQSTPVFLPGESHGQRSLAGYSLWGHKNQTRLTD